MYRDFKPANVLIGDDGRVQVIDFGLVKHSDTPTTSISEDPFERCRDTPAEPHTQLIEPEHYSEGTVTRSPLTDELTRTGAMLGTFAYMAPEQFTHDPIDALTDQFSFFVALYEAIYGQRPFTARSREQLAIRVVEGTVDAPPRGRAVPRWLHKLCLRGLSTDPRERFPSMRAAIDALERGLARRRRLSFTLGVGGALVATAALAFGGARAIPQQQRCAAAGAGRAATLDAQGRDALREAILGTGLPYAEHTWRAVERSLETLVDARARAAQITCVDREQQRLDARALELRERCLAEVDRGLLSFQDELLTSPMSTTPEAIDRATALPNPARCLDDAILARLDSMEGSSRAEHHQELTRMLRDQLDAVERAERSGDYNRGLALARAASDAADELGDDELRARAWYLRGSLELLTGDGDAARSSQDKSARLSERLQEHPLWVRTIADRIASMAGAEARLEDGAWWSDEAQRSIDHLAHSGVAESELLASIGTLHESRGEYERALEFQQRALQLKIRGYGDAHPKTAESLNDIGVLLTRLDRYDEARELLERALELQLSTLGEQHPRVAVTLNNLGALHIRTRDLDAAEAAHRRALAVKRLTLGDQHPSVATTHHNLGWLAHKRERYEDALTHYERALEIRQRALPKDHPKTALTLNAMGVALKRLDRYEEALTYYQRALEIRQRALPERHPQLATSYSNIGKLQLARGRAHEAVDQLERVLEIREQTLEHDDPKLAKALRLLGQARLDARDIAGARLALERALELDERNTDRGRESPTRLAETRFALARALTFSGGPNGARGEDTQRAQTLTRAARSFYEGDETRYANELAAIAAWTQARPGALAQ